MHHRPTSQLCGEMDRPYDRPRTDDKYAAHVTSPQWPDDRRQAVAHCCKNHPLTVVSLFLFSLGTLDRFWLYMIEFVVLPFSFNRAYGAVAAVHAVVGPTATNTASEEDGHGKRQVRKRKSVAACKNLHNLKRMNSRG